MINTRFCHIIRTALHSSFNHGTIAYFDVIDSDVVTTLRFNHWNDKWVQYNTTSV